jgi:hypothetical protein
MCITAIFSDRFLVHPTRVIGELEHPSSYLPPTISSKGFNSRLRHLYIFIYIYDSLKYLSYLLRLVLLFLDLYLRLDFPPLESDIGDDDMSSISITEFSEEPSIKCRFSCDMADFKPFF